MPVILVKIKFKTIEIQFRTESILQCNTCILEETWIITFCFVKTVVQAAKRKHAQWKGWGFLDKITKNTVNKNKSRQIGLHQSKEQWGGEKQSDALHLSDKDSIARKVNKIFKIDSQKKITI